jgi:recombination protein RecA
VSPPKGGCYEDGLDFRFIFAFNEVVHAPPLQAFSPPSPAPQRAPAWNLPALSGRLIELSGSADAASLTAAFGLVLDAQLSGDRAAWVSLAGTSFFPPDVVDGGVDLDALPVVRVPDARSAGRAADHLVRSGGFGLVVIDLVVARGDWNDIGRAVVIPIPLLTRLLGLARAHEAAVVMLTKKSHDAPSLNSLISLRAETGRSSGAGSPGSPGRYVVRVRVLKDKRDGPGRTHSEACRGPAGVR